MEEIIFVTGNKRKLEEFQEKLGNIKGEDIDLIEIQGSAEEIIKHKAKQAFSIIKKPCIVEDTSFGFKAWNWLPGPYFKTFYEKLGIEGIPGLLKDDKTAKATCLIGYAKSEEEIIVVKGEVLGKVVEARNDNGFAFDRIFVADDCEKAFSEMSVEEKNKLSHRGKAIDELKKILDL